MKSIGHISALILLTVTGAALAQQELPWQEAPQTDLPVRYLIAPPIETNTASAATRGHAGLYSARTTGIVASTIPTWTGTDGSYSYTMAGANPAVAGAGTTTITANLIPLIVTFSDGNKFDPTATGTCSAQSPVSLVQASPLFANYSFSAGTTSFGSTQYHDYFQRANFFQYTGPSGVSPNYHLLFSPAQLTAVSITVPAASGSTVAASCGRLGQMEYTWFSTYMQNTVLPALSSMGVASSSLPVFVLYNTVLYQTTTTNCCILGYHGTYNGQLYAIADFDTSGNFGATKDVASMSHELGEFVDDPSASNPTPSWGNIGQVTGCQTNLEVGDPLTGTIFTMTSPSSYVYHLQELAFKSWFYNDATSSGVNGWYSSNGTFTTPAGPCPTSTTKLTVSPTTLAANAAASISISVAAGSGYTGTPTGTVQLYASNAPATAITTFTLAAGSVTSTAVLPAGSYSVTAKYSGDASFKGSTSAAVAVTVGTPSLSFSPVSLTFASQTTGTSSASQAVTVSNPGTAPLNISSIALTGASPGDYSQTNNCGVTLAVSATCTITVTFKPTATGSRTASVSVADNATGSPQTVALSGTGAAPPAPAVSLSPTSLSFASTSVGTTAAALTSTLKNTGTATLTITSLTLSGTNSADYAQTNTCGTSVAAGASCTISVTFKPSATGTRTATLTVADNATGTQTVTLSGTGAAPAVSLSPTSLTFAMSSTYITYFRTIWFGFNNT